MALSTNDVPLAERMALSIMRSVAAFRLVAKPSVAKPSCSARSRIVTKDCATAPTWVAISAGCALPTASNAAPKLVAAKERSDISCVSAAPTSASITLRMFAAARSDAPEPSVAALSMYLRSEFDTKSATASSADPNERFDPEASE